MSESQHADDAKLTSTATRMAPAPTTTGPQTTAVEPHFPDGFWPLYLVKVWPAGVPDEHQAAAQKVMTDALAEAQAALQPSDPVAPQAWDAAPATHTGSGAEAATQKAPPPGVTTGSQYE